MKLFKTINKFKLNFIKKDFNRPSKMIQFDQKHQIK